MKAWTGLIAAALLVVVSPALGVDIERDVIADQGRPLRFARNEPAWQAFMRSFFESRREDAGVSSS